MGMIGFRSFCVLVSCLVKCCVLTLARHLAPMVSLSAWTCGPLRGLQCALPSAGGTGTERAVRGSRRLRRGVVLSLSLVVGVVHGSGCSANFQSRVCVVDSACCACISLNYGNVSARLHHARPPAHGRRGPYIRKLSQPNANRETGAPSDLPPGELQLLLVSQVQTYDRMCIWDDLMRLVTRTAAAHDDFAASLEASRRTRARGAASARQPHSALLGLADFLVVRALERLAVAQDAQVTAVVRGLAEAPERLLNPENRRAEVEWEGTRCQAQRSCRQQEDFILHRRSLRTRAVQHFAGGAACFCRGSEARNACDAESTAEGVALTALHPPTRSQRVPATAP